MTDVLSEIIELLTSGISGIASGIGQGLQELVTKIFLDTSTSGATKLSVFGGVIIIFAGVSLAVGLCRFVTNWVTTLGN